MCETRRLDSMYDLISANTRFGSVNACYCQLDFSHLASVTIPLHQGDPIPRPFFRTVRFELSMIASQ